MKIITDIHIRSGTEQKRGLSRSTFVVSHARSGIDIIVALAPFIRLLFQPYGFFRAAEVRTPQRHLRLSFRPQKPVSQSRTLRSLQSLISTSFKRTEGKSYHAQPNLCRDLISAAFGIVVQARTTISASMKQHPPIISAPATNLRPRERRPSTRSTCRIVRPML